MRVKITPKDSPSKPTIINMSRKLYDFLLENCKTPDYLKERSEAKTIIETDDILGIKVFDVQEAFTNSILMVLFKKWKEANND